MQGGRVQFAEGQKSKEFGLQAKFDELASVIERFNSKADTNIRNSENARGVVSMRVQELEQSKARLATANAAAGQASQAQAQRQQGGQGIADADIKAIRQSLESQLPKLTNKPEGKTEVNIINKVDQLNRSALRAQGII